MNWHILAYTMLIFMFSFMVDDWYTHYILHSCLVYLYTNSTGLSILLQWKLWSCENKFDDVFKLWRCEHDYTVEEAWNGRALAARVTERHIMKTIYNCTCSLWYMRVFVFGIFYLIFVCFERTVSSRMLGVTEFRKMMSHYGLQWTFATQKHVNTISIQNF